MQLRNTTAIVTGAANGLGYAISRAILHGGGRVLMTDIAQKDLESSWNELSAVYHEHVQFHNQDVTSKDSFDIAFDVANEYFPLHQVNVLVNNAGIVHRWEGYYKSPEDRGWEKLVDINITAVLRGTQVALQRLSKSRGTPVVINVASIGGIYPVSEIPIYSATKAAVISFSESCGAMVPHHHVRVVAVCPGTTDTDMGRKLIAANPAVVDAGVMSTTEVAEAFVSCLSDETNSGQTMIVTKRGTKYRRSVARL